MGNLLIESSVAYDKIKENLSENIENKNLKKLFFEVMDNVREYYMSKIKPNGLSGYEIGFTNKILLPLIKRARLEELNNSIQKLLNEKEQNIYKPGDKIYDGIASIVKYSNPPTIGEGYNIIDIDDNQEYMVYRNKETDALYYIKNNIKHYIIWG